jgi:hypothetical protein
MKNNYTRSLSALFVLLLLSFASTNAQSSGEKIPFQGVLYEQGVPVSGSKTVIFSIAEVGWEETQNVQVINGLYSTVLGSVTPLPYDLFYDKNAYDLNIKIDGTSIGDVRLHKSFVGLGRKIDVSNLDSLGQTDAFDASITGANVNNSFLKIGINGSALTENGSNVGVFGRSRSISTNSEFQYGVLGRADGEGSGARYGIRGEVFGTGTGYSAGTRGQSFVIPEVNGRTYGGAFTAFDGVIGATSYGVSGDARGPGKNIGVYGNAFNGEENWAGWFDGDVKITGNLITDLPINLPRRVYVDDSTVNSDTVFHYTIDANNTVRGFQVDMNGAGTKFAVRGNNNSQASDTGFKLGVIGSSVGQGTGDHEGVRGQAFGNGKYNSGAIGLSGGAGNGATGYGNDGSYNNGVSGYAHSNAWGNTGVYGNAGGVTGVDNNGVVGLANVGDSTNTSIVNQGVLGRAEGPGINKGVVGVAKNGVENWAGWFDGDVKITGNLMTDLPLNLPRRTLITDSLVSSDTLFHIQVDASNTVRGLQVDMNGSGTKFAVRGNSNSQATDDGFKIGVLGSSIGQGTGSHEGVRGQAYGNGLTNKAFLGLAGGAGNGVVNTDSTLGSYNYGTLSFALNNSNGNTGVFGQASGSTGVDNHGGAFLGEVNDGTTTIVNNGVRGRAEGPGINKGVVGVAKNGVENWAGWFEGDVNILGSLEMQSVTVPGANGNRSVYLSSEGPDGNDGNIRLSNENGQTRGILFANRYNQLNDSTREYTGSGGGWFSGNNGKMSVNFGSRSGDNNHGFLDLGDALGNVKMSLNVDHDRGYLSMNDSLGNRSIAIFPGKTSPGQFYSYNKNQKVTGWFGGLGGTDGGHGFMQLVDYNDDGSASEGAILAGFFAGKPELYLELGDGEHLADLSIENNTGKLWLKDTLGSTFNVTSTGLDFVNSSTNQTISLDGNTGNMSLAGDVNVTGGLRTDSNMGVWFDNGGGNDEYALTNVLTGGNNGAVYGNLYLKDDLGNTLNLSGEGHVDASGNINAGGIVTAGTVTLTSDARLKTNINQLNNALSNVMKLRGVSYTWIDLKKTRKNQIGVIAQEVEEIYPEFVHTNKDGMKSVNYSQMTAVLIEAVKELNSKITNLENENSAMKAELSKVSTLEEKINRIEKLLGSKEKVEKPTAALSTSTK